MSIKKTFRGEDLSEVLNSDTLNQVIDAGFLSTQQDETINRQQEVDQYFAKMWGSQKGYLKEPYVGESHPAGAMNIKYREPFSGVTSSVYFDPDQWHGNRDWVFPMYAAGSSNPPETHEFVHAAQGLGRGQIGSATYLGLVQAVVKYGPNMQHCRRVDVDTLGRLYATWEGRGWVVWKEPGKDDDEQEVCCVVSFESPQHQVVIGTTFEEILPDDYGTVLIKIRNPDDGTEPSASPEISAWLDWMHGNESIEQDTKVGCMWFPREKIWRILWADCPGEDPAEGYIQHDYASGTVQQSLSSNTPDLVDVSVWDTAYSTGNATADVSNGRITLPNVPAGGQNYNAEFSATVNSNIAHTEVKFFHYVNGTQFDLISTATNVDANHDMSLSGFSLMNLSSGTAPSVEIYVEADKNITLTYSDIKTKISKNVRI